MDGPTINKAFGYLADGDAQQVSYTATAGAATIARNSQYIVTATSNCYVIFTNGGSASATTSDHYIVADTPYWLGTDSAVNRISVVRATADGTLHVSKLTERSG